MRVDDDVTRGVWHAADAMSALLTVMIDGHVATVTLETLTMPPAFFAACEERFVELAERQEVRAVVVRAAGKAFSYGLDLPQAFAEHGTLFAGAGLAAQRQELYRLVRRLQGAFTAIEACPVPVIAAIHGRCIGGGLDLAAACDIRLASADAQISLRETKIAIVADLGSLQRLPAIIGQGHTRELAFTGKDLDAARAREIGLVNEVYADRDALWSAAAAMADEIAANAPLTVRGVKQVLEMGKQQSVAEGLDYVATYNAAFLPSNDLSEAVQAFAQKRPPRYRGS